MNSVVSIPGETAVVTGETNLSNYSDYYDEWDNSEEIECPSCYGTGLDRDEIFDCAECYGEGFIVINDYSYGT